MENAIEVVTTRSSTLTAAGDRRPPVPLPELPITVRLATNDDIPFIDELQKRNNKSLGFMPQKALEGKIKREEILIAEEVGGLRSTVGGEDTGGVPTVAPDSDSVLPTADCRLPTTPVGYLIGNDRYQKRDELGCIFQLCVVPGKRRGLVGATLLKSLFERASYGCKLYCCWCAQDLEANYFWESMGFVPVAFRTGSRNKNKRQDGQKGARIHIFWQKRIRAGDKETPYWYPHETNGGSIGEDRLVLPIDPRIHWSQVKLEVLPGEEVGGQQSAVGGEDSSHLLPTADSPLPTESAGEDARPSNTTESAGEDARPSSTKPKRVRAKQPVPQAAPSKRLRLTGVMSFAPAKPVASAKPEKAKREKPVKQKNDPAKVKAARYIRDRYMEEINRGDHLVSHGKYDVTRLIENAPVPLKQMTGERCEGSPHRPVPPTPVLPDQKLLAA